MTEFKELYARYRTEFNKSLQNKLTECIESEELQDEDLILSAVASLLIKRCMKGTIKKEDFLEKISLGWDYYAKEEKNG